MALQNPSIPLESVYEMRADPRLKNMTAVACWNEADNIVLGLDTDPVIYDQTNNANRRIWAAEALRDLHGDGLRVQEMLRLVLQNPTIQTKWAADPASVEDGDVIFAVRGRNVDFFAEALAQQMAAQSQAAMAMAVMQQSPETEKTVTVSGEKAAGADSVQIVKNEPASVIYEKNDRIMRLSQAIANILEE